jgi:two-component system nitrogen regulation response regulator GlnG
MQAQTRLLRALQSGTIRRVGGSEDVRIDARIVAATNRDLQPMIAAGQFREDLFYRINVVPIDLPPLRDRPDDIEALARHFLQQAASEGLPRRRLSDDAIGLLSHQTWRGNVRELKNFIFRMALLAREELIDGAAILPMLEQIRASGTGESAGQSGDLDIAVAQWLVERRPEPGTIYDKALAAFERPLFSAVLEQTGGNQLRAAQLLGINRNTLRKRLGELTIDPEAFVQR